MLTVALTGGIATGKSVVAEILRNKGCYIEKADLAGHDLMLPGGEAYQAVVNHFGEKIITAEGLIDRRRLAQIIFAEPEERAYLDSLTHPLILEKVRETMARLEKSGEYEIYVNEAALVIEAGYQTFYDRIVLTFCQPGTQIKRLSQRDGLSAREARLKIKSQWPLNKKIPLADYLIDTSGQLTETIEQAEELYFRLYQDAQLKKMGKLIKDID
jgi:dephospho-CoA kinase